MADLAAKKEDPMPECPTLLKGGSVTKLGRRGSPHQRTFTLSKDRARLNWTSKSFIKSSNATSGELLSDTRTMEGVNSAESSPNSEITPCKPRSVSTY